MCMHVYCVRMLFILFLHLPNASHIQFAIDEKGLFDDPAAAAKVAGHDLKGLNCYVNCNIEGLCYPLMALLDYRGQRLIAISLIPIDHTTLVYGTAGTCAAFTSVCVRACVCACECVLSAHGAGLKPFGRFRSITPRWSMTRVSACLLLSAYACLCYPLMVCVRARCLCGRAVMSFRFISSLYSHT